MAQMPRELADYRKEYVLAGLDEQKVPRNPMVLFRAWLDEAERAGVEEHNAMTVATTGLDGSPNSRIVLLKNVHDDGLVFFTNYASEKGREISADPRVALVFCWLSLERQVRIRGRAEQVSQEESAEYFSKRPRGSQLGAWASSQSEHAASRGELDASLAKTEMRFADQVVPLPPEWGGFRVIPHAFEFWQGRPNRMHDRVRYSLDRSEYRIERLWP